MTKCRHCDNVTNIKKITVPVERRGKIVTFKKVHVCPACLLIYYPEYAVINNIGEIEPKTYEVMVRGRKTTMKGRRVE